MWTLPPSQLALDCFSHRSGSLFRSKNPFGFLPKSKLQSLLFAISCLPQISFPPFVSDPCDQKITVAVSWLWCLPIQQALVRKWTVQIWNLQDNAYESLSRMLCLLGSKPSSAPVHPYRHVILVHSTDYRETRHVISRPSYFFWANKYLWPSSFSSELEPTMSFTSHGSSTVYDSARRCILSILSFFPQTFGPSVLPSLEPKITSTDDDSTVYDIIFVGGYFIFYSIRVAVLLTTWIGSGGAAACVTAGRLAEADPFLKILVRFQKKV